MQISKRLHPSFLYGFAILLYAMALSWFLWSLMGIENPPILRRLPLYIAGTAFLLFLGRFKKLIPILLGLVLAVGLMTWPADLHAPNVPFLWQWGKEIYEAFRWGLTINAYKGAMPLSFSAVLAGSTLLVSYLLLYVASFPPASLLVLTLPLYFLPDITNHPLWIYWLFVGLAGITVSLYRSVHSRKMQWPHPGVVTAILLAVLLLGHIITPQTFFSTELSTSLNRMNDRRTGRIYGSFSLSRTGYMADTGVLGGPVNPTDRPMLDVTGLSYSYYLRGSVYTEFEGDRWRLPPLTENVVLDPRVIIAPTDPYSNALGHSILGRRTDLQDRSLGFLQFIEQAPRVPNLRTVFSPGFILMVRTPPPIRPSVWPKNEEFWGQPEIKNEFRLTPDGLLFADQSIDEGVILYGLVLDTQTLRNRPASLYDFGPVRIEPRYAYADLVREKDPVLYSLVYQELNDAVIRGHAPVFSQILGRIRDHFQNHYPYTLTPSPIPGDSDILSHFLETREGYCVYYGTLTTELLQDIGVRARYAEGFVAPAAEEEGTLITVTGKYGHAWTEIEYENAGWIPFDTTPAVQLEFLSGTVEELPREPSADGIDDVLDPQESRATTESERETALPETDPVPATEEETIPSRLGETILRFHRPIALFLFIAGWLLWRKWVFWARHDEEWLAEKYRHQPEKLVENIWRDIHALSKLEDTSFHTGTPRDILLTMAQVYSVRDLELISKSVWIVERVLYGEQSISFPEAEPLLHFHRSLENRVRAYMSPWEWRFKRWIWTRRNPL